MELRLWALRWGDYLGLSVWAQCNHRASYKKDAEHSES